MKKTGLDADINELNGGVPEKPLRKRTWIKVLGIILVIILLLSGIIVVYANHFLNSINYAECDFDSLKDVNIMEIVEELPEERINEEYTVEKDEINWDIKDRDLIKNEKHVYNFLLCGVEAIGGGRGRTDAILIATINEEQKSLKLTSLMRDTYVYIEGHNNNKLNASYTLGGMALLQDTVEKNFDIKIDGYILVNFDGFKAIIDRLGGVEIELTKEEADYLNSTNYIADERYRNVVPGKQIMNGEQALGYSRVRHVKTKNKLQGDFGRNYRQRVLLQSIFNKYKSKNIVEILTILPDLLKLVTTDLDKMDIIKYATMALQLDVSEIETYRVPSEGTYKNAMINERFVLYITDMDKLRQGLKEFIYGVNETASEQTVE